MIKRTVSAALAAVMLLSSSGISAFGAELPFKDVKKEDWYYQFAEKTYASGVLKGVSADEFSPHINMTRAMFVQALANNSSTFDKSKVRETPMFIDAAPKEWYFDAVQWAAELHIVSGVGEGKFNPNGLITRADMCVMLSNYAMTSSPFFEENAVFKRNARDLKDFANVPNYADGAVCWAYDNEIIEGMGDGTLNPKGNLTRAQAAAVLSKMDKVNDPSYETEAYEFGLKDAEPIVSLDLPKFWKEDCVIERTESTEPQKDITALAVFYSKKNMAASDELKDAETAKREGMVFVLDLIKGKEVSTMHRKIGETIIGGDIYSIAGQVRSELRGMADRENYVRMSWNAAIAIENAHLLGIKEELKMNTGRFAGTILTLPMPAEWKGKYTAEYTIDKSGHQQLDLYETENHKDLTYDGWIFSISFVKGSNSQKLADIDIDGGSGDKIETVYLNTVSDVRYDSDNAELRKSYMDIYLNISTAIDNIWFGDDVIVVRRYDIAYSKAQS